jgi:hypothetical protein
LEDNVSLTPSEDVSSEQTISVPVELDDDGFLRRECPHCEREFKWLPADDSEPMQAGGYHCPYCNCQADADQWFTKAQIDYLQAVGMQEFVEPLLDEFEQSFNRPKRGGRSLISARFERADAPTPIKPHEPNDMRRVDFRCHAKEPVKVLDSRSGPVHCLICGTPSEART